MPRRLPAGWNFSMGKRGAALSRRELDRAKNYQARSTRANGHWNLTMQTAWGSALTAVEDIAFLQSQWKPAFQIIADRLAEKTDRAFSSGITPDGKSFRPIGKEYARYKNGRAYLYLSGKLRSSASRSSPQPTNSDPGVIFQKENAGALEAPGLDPSSFGGTI